MEQVRRALRNLAGLALVALPLAIVAGWVMLLVAEHGSRSDRSGAGGYVGAFLFLWLVEVLPFLAGGIVHQALLAVLPAARTPRAARILVLCTAPVILVVPFGFGYAPETIVTPIIFVPVLVGLLCYAALAVPLRARLRSA